MVGKQASNRRVERAGLQKVPAPARASGETLTGPGRTVNSSDCDRGARNRLCDNSPLEPASASVDRTRRQRRLHLSSANSVCSRRAALAVSAMCRRARMRAAPRESCVNFARANKFRTLGAVILGMIADASTSAARRRSRVSCSCDLCRRILRRTAAAALRQSSIEITAIRSKP